MGSNLFGFLQILLLMFYLRNLCLVEGNKDFLLFSSGSFIVLVFACGSIIHIELIFSYNDRYRSTYTFLYWISSRSNTILLTHFPLNLLWWHWFIKFYRFQVYPSITHHLYIGLRVHHPRSSLLPSPLALLYPLLPLHLSLWLSPGG